MSDELDDLALRGRLARLAQAVPISTRPPLAEPRVGHGARARVDLGLATLGVLIVIVALAIGTSRSISAGPSPEATSAGPSPEATTELATYSGNGLRFEYPSSWRIIAQGIQARHYESIHVVLGTGDWTLNCHAIPPSGQSGGGGECGQDIWNVAAGQVVVEISSWGGPGGPASPPPGTLVLPSGLSATVVDTGTSSVWTIYVPAVTQGNVTSTRGTFIVEARFADPGAQLARAAVLAVVQSLTLAK